MNILITGGLGYIGLDLCVKLLKEHNVVILDDCSVYLDKINYINENAIKSPKYMNASLLDLDRLYGLFRDTKIDYIIHCASYKSIFESTIDPFKYYNNNLKCILNLIQLSKKLNCKNIINCSSSSVYGNNSDMLKENMELKPINPYSKIKVMEENILEDLYKSDNSWNITNLRIFNPINPRMYKRFGPYKDLIGSILTSIKNKTTLEIYNKDTVRDYFHIDDLIEVFILLVNQFNSSGYRVYNVGSGIGTSSLNLVDLIGGDDIQYTLCESRIGDVIYSVSDTTKIKTELNWFCTKTIYDIVLDIKNLIL